MTGNSLCSNFLTTDLCGNLVLPCHLPTHLCAIYSFFPNLPNFLLQPHTQLRTELPISLRKTVLNFHQISPLIAQYHLPCLSLCRHRHLCVSCQRPSLPQGLGPVIFPGAVTYQDLGLNSFIFIISGKLWHLNLTKCRPPFQTTNRVDSTVLLIFQADTKLLMGIRQGERGRERKEILLAERMPRDQECEISIDHQTQNRTWASRGKLNEA